MPDMTASDFDGYCKECGKPTRGKWLDFGIGDYEYWGETCHDTDWQYVSTCCDAELHANPALNELIDPPD